MASCTENRLFKLFIVIVFLSHCVQLVWNSPVQELLAPATTHAPLKTRTYPNVEVYKAKQGSPSPQSNNLNKDPPVPVAAKANSQTPPEQMDALCSLFKSFLGSEAQKNVKCKINSVFEVKSNPAVDSQDVNAHAKQTTGLFDLFEASASESLNSIQDSSSRIDIVGHTFDGYTDTGSEAESLTSQIPFSLLHGSSHPQPQYGPNPSGYDDTKVLRHKSTIIVPQHGNRCPYGQRKDYHGHCRTIVRFSRPVFHPGQFIGSPNVGPPVRYYYKKYIAVPTLHFIIH